MKSFLLGSQREPEPEVDRQLGLQDLRRKNAACEHVLIVGEPGPATLALKMRGQDVCPHCTRREAAYWRGRAKSAEGLLREAQETAHQSGICGTVLEEVQAVLDRGRPVAVPEPTA